MKKVKEEQRKKQIVKAASPYFAEDPENVYTAYMALLRELDKGNGDDLASDYILVWDKLEDSMTIAELIELIENDYIELIENDYEEPDMPELYRSIDWELLKQQKKSLLKVIEDCDNVPVLEHLEGILVFIDALQDDAVDNFGVDENLVFDLTEVKYRGVE